MARTAAQPRLLLASTAAARWGAPKVHHAQEGYRVSLVAGHVTYQLVPRRLRVRLGLGFRFAAFGD